MAHTCSCDTSRCRGSRFVVLVLTSMLGFAGSVHGQDAAKAVAFDCSIQADIPIEECEALVDLFLNTNGAAWSRNDGWLITNAPCTWYGVSCSAGHVGGLVLGGIGLTGSIPDGLGDLSNLGSLELSGNSLTGPIPDGLRRLANLTILWLNSNELTGPIPDWLGGLGNLTQLNLNYNELTGPIPESLGNLSQLQFLNLYGNHLSGQIPESLGRLPNILDIVLAYNELTGPIPESIGNLHWLWMFFARGNRLTGTIPPTLDHPEMHLDLRENNLEGTLPLAVANGTAECDLTDNIPGVCVPDIPEYQALASDGKICGLPLDPNCKPVVHVRANVLLEGPYASGTMRAVSMFTDHCPATQPYSDPIFDGTPLDCDRPDVVSSPPDSVMDWVLVSLRTAVSHASEVPGSERAAFLLTNGSIVDTTGRILAFPGVAPGPYRLVVRHRNHGSVMSADTLDLSDGFGSWDFTTAMTQAYTDGGAPMKQLRDGRFGMFACDANVDGGISGPDFDVWNARTTVGATGYEQADCNLDGHVTAPDFNLWNANTTAGARSQVPD